MREIEFRGRRVDNKEWEFGSLFIDEYLNEYSIQGYDYYYDEGGKQRKPFWYRYRDWETDRKSTRLNSSHSAKSRMPSSA